MTVSVVGASGMLGQRVIYELHTRGNSVIQIPKVRFGIDKFNPMHFAGADVIINCAGSIALKNSTPVEMIEANTIGPWQLAAAAKEWGSRLIHMSTDIGSDETYDSLDFYSRTKLAGEPQGENVVVVRGSFIGLEHGFFRWILDATGSVQAWTKAWWNGGSVGAMAKALVDLSEGDKQGTINVAAKEPVTKAWMIEYIIDKLDLSLDTILLTDKPVIRRDLVPDIFLPPVSNSLDELIGEVNGE